MPKEKLSKRSKFTPSSPLQRKLFMTEDIKSSSDGIICDTQGCKSKISHVSYPCKELKLCNRCMAKRRNNYCDKCGTDVEDWITFRKYKSLLNIPKDPEESSLEKCLHYGCVNPRDFCAFPCGCFIYCKDCKEVREKLSISTCFCGRKIDKFTRVFCNHSVSPECVICHSHRNILCSSTCGHLICSSCKLNLKNNKCPYCRAMDGKWSILHYHNEIIELSD